MRRRKGLWASTLMGLGASGLVLFLYQRQVDFLQRWEWKWLDLRYQIRGPIPVWKDILIVAADEASLETMGQWPWPRRTHARLIDFLRQAGARGVAFDILFIEKDRQDPPGDNLLVTATRRFPGTLHSMFFLESGRAIEPRLPFSELLDATPYLASVNAYPDADGVLRRARVYTEVRLSPSPQPSPPRGEEDQKFLSPGGRGEGEGGTVRIPLLSVNAAALGVGKVWEDMITHLPLDAKHELQINFAGPAGTFQHISYAKVLRGEVPAQTFKDKIILVGATATGLYDHYPTPLDKYFPGIEFHANVISSLLRRDYLRNASPRLTLGLILGFGLLCGLLLARLSPWLGMAFALALGAGFWQISYALFAKRHIVVEVVPPLLALLGSYLVIVVYRFWAEAHEKRWVRTAFGQYLSPKVMEIVLAHPDQLRLGGERREMTFYFSDLAGFTTLSEHMPVEQLVPLLNEYLTEMSEIILKHDGVVNKYIGDAIMAYWNAPVAQPKHAELACLAALESQEVLARLNEKWKERKLPELRARIGVHTGPAVVGNMGSKKLFDYTGVGDTVNTASRLEGANKQFETAIMISETAYQAAQDAIEVRMLDRITVKGKSVPVRVYELVARKGQMPEDRKQAIGRYHEALQLFWQRKFDEALAIFQSLAQQYPPDGVYRAYIQRAQHYLEVPPPVNWDGVYVLTTK